MSEPATRGSSQSRRHVALVGGIACAVGVVTGLVVLGIEHAVEAVVEEIFHGPVWLPAVAVAGGIGLTAIVVHTVAGKKTASTEVYVEDFHEPEPELEARFVPGRLFAAFTTLGSGAPLGMEGPAVYSGSAIGTLAWRRWPDVAASANTFLVAGAAAGVAAVFKAPVAGVLFALEVPFRSRIASERLLSALVGSAAGFMTMATVDGVKAENPLPAVELTYGRVAASALLGAVIGVIAIGVIALVRAAEHGSEGQSAWLGALLGGGGLAAVYAIGRSATDETLGLGSGNEVINWVLSPDHGVWLLVLVLLLRIAGPALSIFGGGVGGLFIPLMAIGAVVGRLFADALSIEDLSLHVMVGASTMLGVGYAAPVTGVVFIAEYTGQASFIIPGLVAMTVAVLVAGNRSVSPAQRA